jgi:hypothetical protein
MIVIPLPKKGSKTSESGVELLTIGRRINSTGFWVPWPVSDFR